MKLPATLGLIAQLLFSSSDATDSFTMLPSTCENLEDGLHYIQPMGSNIYKSLTSSDETPPPIRAMCSNGYTIIDPSIDNNVIKYFSTWHEYHTTFAGPDLDEGINWRVWWLPTRMDFSATFYVSEDCETVETDNEDIQVYGDQTGYYMTGDSYGCNWPTKAMCDFDADTLQCYTCSTNSDTSVKTLTQNGVTESESQEYYGKCGHMPYPITSVGATDHSSCTEDTGSFLPSIGLTGKYCVAYKMSSSGTKSIMSDPTLVDYGLTELEEEAEVNLFADSIYTVYLDQEDFLEGTYRITRPGTYIISEDIEFDFNGGKLTDPNVAGSWFPDSSQSEDYPGAGEWDGHYWLGFFAGITIETSDVTLDLNGHSIGMSAAFYFQQRFFSCIELNNKIFLDGEGPTWTGTDITFAENVVIKDGTVGLSSHIGIHGNKVTNLELSNVHVRDFETHGIGINEYYNLQINNVEIGPSIDGQLGLNGNYNLARYTLPIFRAAATDAGIGKIQFQDRDDKVTFSSIVSKLTQQMNMVFKYAYLGEESDSDEWDIAQRTFINDWGISRAGTIYGAIFRSRGASVFNYGKDTGSGYSTDLSVNGLYIHDIKLCMEEIIALGISQNSWMRDVFNAPLNLEAFTNNEFESLYDTKYVGNAYLDAVLALKYFSSSWWYLGRLAIVEPFVTWARMIDSSKIDDDDKTQLDILDDIDHTMYLHCNYDSLGHVPKGVVGLRMELSSNIEINDLRIEDLYSFTPLGSEKCGAYKSGTDGGMPLQASTTNPGFGGTQVRAINLYGVSDMNVDNVQIKNIMSLNGPAYGIHGHSGKGVSSGVQFSNVEFEGIYSGVDLTVNCKDYSEDQWPNPKASACAVEQANGISFDHDTTSASCIFGHTGCNKCENDGLCSSIGTYNDECSNELTVDAKDLSYSIEADGSITTEVTDNSYKDAYTRLGTSALKTVSMRYSTSSSVGSSASGKAGSTAKASASAANSDATEEDEIEDEVEETESKSSNLLLKKKMTPISFQNNLEHSGNGSNNGNNDDGMSDTTKMFFYGSILLILLVFVVISRKYHPKYRSRKANLETFETKLKYGKHAERLVAEREQEQLNKSKTKEDLVRLMSNTLNGNNDNEYDQI